jgi:hypothetical protein
MRRILHGNAGLLHDASVSMMYCITVHIKWPLAVRRKSSA